MAELWDGIIKMLTQFKIDPTNDSSIFVFAVCCGITGILAMALELIVYTLTGSSLLDLKHGEKNSFILLLLWTIGALIMGYLGQMLWVFQPSMVACLVVGFTWPILATKMLEQLKNREIANEPVQEVE